MQLNSYLASNVIIFDTQSSNSIKLFFCDNLCYKKTHMVIFTLHNYILIRKITRNLAKLKLSACVL